MSLPVPPGIQAPEGAGRPARSWTAYRSEFPIVERATYLNSCSLGAPGVRVRAAIATCLRRHLR